MSNLEAAAWDGYRPKFVSSSACTRNRVIPAYIPPSHLPGLLSFLAGEAENQLANITDQQRGGKGPKKGAASSTNTLVPSRKAGSKGKRYGGGPATTDEQLMSRLGEILGGNMREDFIVVHMHQPCTFCRTHIRGPNIVYR